MDRKVSVFFQIAVENSEGNVVPFFLEQIGEKSRNLLSRPEKQIRELIFDC